jgi:sporulation protein YlmC with PRC-barrel domain
MKTIDRKMLPAFCVGVLAAMAAAQTDPMKSSESAPTYTTAEKLLDCEVKDRSGEKLGELEDLGVDSASGDVVFAVVSTGGVLGIGEKDRVLAPEGARIEPTGGKDKVCTVPVTKAQLEAAPQYDADHLEEYYQRMKRGAAATAKGDADPYRDAFADSSRAVTLEGEIKSVETDRGVMIARVADKKTAGREVKVILGPDEYVKAQGWTPASGDRIEVDAAEASSTDPGVYVARAVSRTNGPTLHLREKGGEPMWDRPSCLLLSKLDGCKIMAGGEEIGSVEDVVVMNASAVEFVTVEADEIKDMKDATLLIPWSALTVDKDCVLHLQKSALELQSAPKVVAENANEINDAEFRARVHTFYGTQARSEKR